MAAATSGDMALRVRLKQRPSIPTSVTVDGSLSG
jgi:hypothetical protein